MDYCAPPNRRCAIIVGVITGWDRVYEVIFDGEMEVEPGETASEFLTRLNLRFSNRSSVRNEASWEEADLQQGESRRMVADSGESIRAGQEPLVARTLVVVGL